MNTIPVFVYGSLKQGFGNNHYLKTSYLVGQYKTINPYFMISLGAFPGVIKNTIKDNRSGFITGEFYNVSQNTMEGLDRLEGNGFFYTREQIEITPIKEKIPFKDVKLAWLYFLNRNEVNSINIIHPDEHGNLTWKR